MEWLKGSSLPVPEEELSSWMVEGEVDICECIKYLIHTHCVELSFPMNVVSIN